MTTSAVGRGTVLFYARRRLERLADYVGSLQRRGAGLPESPR